MGLYPKLRARDLKRLVAGGHERAPWLAMQYTYMAMCHLRGALGRVRVKGYTIA